MSNSIFSSDDYPLSFDDFLDNILVDFPSQNSPMLSSGSDNSTRTTNSSGSGSDDGEPHKWKAIKPIDERRQKRLVSNRESAMRSRKRKQKHLENLKSQVTRYDTVNQDLTKRLRFVNHNVQMVQKENQTLRLESLRLQQKLYGLHLRLRANPELHQPLLTSAWPCNNNVTTINDQNQSTLITF